MTHWARNRGVRLLFSELNDLGTEWTPKHLAVLRLKVVPHLVAILANVPDQLAESFVLEAF